MFKPDPDGSKVSGPVDKNLSLIKDNLRRIQEEGGSGNFVIFLADEQANYFIQFAGQNRDPMLIGEAPENRLIPDAFTLIPAKLKILEDLGWQFHAHSGMNYSQEWQAVTDKHRSAIAQVVLQTFQQVYGVDINQPLKVEINLS